MNFRKSAICAIALPLCFAASAAHAVNVEKTWHRWVLAGDADRTQERLHPAEDCYRKALEAIGHADHTAGEMVTCLEKLASTLVLEDKTEEAISLYQKAVKMIEHESGKDSAAIVPTLFALGSIYESVGDHELAMNLYSRALQINERTYGPLSPAVATALHRLGRASFHAGKVEQAEHNYKQSLAILVNQPSLTASNELESLLADYSDLLHKKDSVDSDLVSDFQTEFLKDNPKATMASAKPMPQSAWQRQITARITKNVSAQTNEEQKVMLRGFKEPFSNATLSPAYQEMSEVLSNQAANKENEDHFERMIAIDAKALGPNHPSVADDLTSLATLYIGEHRYTDARPLLNRALTIYRTVYGSNNMMVARTQSLLAKCDNAMGNPDQASTLYGNIFDNQMASSPNSIETAQTLNDLGYLYYRQGKLDDASTIYQWALPSTEAATGQNSALTAACLADYANVLTGLGKVKEANVMQARALRILATLPHTPQ